MPSSPIDIMRKIPEIELQKQALRRHYREERAALAAETRALLDAALCLNAAELPCFQAAKTLLAYYPIGSEPDLRPLLALALKRGKRVELPVCDPDTATLTFRLIDTYDALPKGHYAIPEPTEDAPAVTDFQDSICLVPALAFDREGYRIGYGKGYYDRFLAHYRGFTVGLVYSGFVTACLPREKTDRAVSILMTERGILLPNEEV